MATSDGLEIVDPENPEATYISVFVLIALDAVMPIFPGETTLNAAATRRRPGQARALADHRHGGPRCDRG